MNNFTDRYNRDLFKAIYLHGFIILPYIFCLFDSVASYKYIYDFERNSNSNILFFNNKPQNEMRSDRSDVDFQYKFLNDCSILYYEATHVFMYEKDNFISFEVLNHILALQKSEKLNGIIECNFNLYYFLKTTKEITEIPDEINHTNIKTILLGLKCLKAVNCKNITKYIHALLVKILLNHKKNALMKNYMYMEGLFDLNFWSNIDEYIKKSFISGFLEIYMLKHIFYDGNLIVLENVKSDYLTSIFNDHIPYKNILINSCKVFLCLEKMLLNTLIFNFFQILLNLMNLKSLILDGLIEYEIPNLKFKFHIFYLETFKSIVFFNFMKSSSSLFLENHSVLIRNDIEFLQLELLKVSRNVLRLLLDKKNPIGLVLKNISIPHSTVILNRNINFCEKLRYAQFQNVGINPFWWNNLFFQSNVQTLILSFNTISSEESFIREFSKSRSTVRAILHLEISFYYTEITKEFFDSLLNLNHLRTLKLQTYKTNEQTEIYLINSIKNMNRLENIDISQNFFSTKSYNILFMKDGIETLYLKNDEFEINILEIAFTGNYKLLKQIGFSNMTIGITGLIEIFKLENLEMLSFECCIFESIDNFCFSYSKSQYLKCLHLHDLDLNTNNFMYALIKLDFLEILKISYCKIQPGLLTELGLMCDKSLSILSFEFGFLNSNDLNRIKNIKVLEDLNLMECRFFQCNFWELGNDCKFFNSLKVLNLCDVKINIEDLRYLRKFKNLMKLSLTISDSYILSEKDCLIYLLALTHLSKSKIKLVIKSKLLYRLYINEF
ncbi:hypothetical protein CWI37_0452p0010 [Hamiltosporidium tvaerminnensis]|uniref:Uncharacterized protein n=1 Tax=Hamiltosporidium tvaerminnensis TaxID=1176355 RepID=A0A4Q9L6S9_9MICR|nr:hypothetical protein CWI37_0452p0010 [Hamiltosporidium tvaerminnensis]